MDEVFSAYAKLKLVRWAGEHVDVYTNKIQQLARMAGFTGSSLEMGMKLAFVRGLLNDISTSTGHRNVEHGRFADKRYG